MRISNHSFRTATTRCLFAGLLFTTAVGFAQNPGWRRADEPAPNVAADPSTPVAQPQPEPQPGDPLPADPQAEPQANPPAGPQANPQTYPPAGAVPPAAIPPRLTIPAGKYLTVRVNQPISTDHNQVGDFFTATLAEPIVVDGVVVAQQGQTVSGRVSLVGKGGRVSGVSKLGVQLTELTAVDGQQLPIQTQFVGRNARTTNGRDVAAVATTTGVGAAIGAAADWGRGAAIGAGAGAVVGLAGVLLTRGAPAVIYPETLLSFQMQAPATVSTNRVPQAFRYVDPNQYSQPPVYQTRMNGGAPPPPYGAYPAPAYPYASAYGYPYGYGYPYYPYGYYPYWGPGFGVFIGPRFGYYGYRGGFGFRGAFRR